jgi:hypothetical protein
VSKPVWGVISGWSSGALVGIVALAILFVSIDMEGSVDAASLNRSLQYEFDSNYEVKDPHCRNTRADRWICGVTGRPSGVRGGYYDVETSGSDWTATRRGDDHSYFAEEAPETIESYVSPSAAREPNAALEQEL